MIHDHFKSLILLWIGLIAGCRGGTSDSSQKVIHTSDDRHELFEINSDQQLNTLARSTFVFVRRDHIVPSDIPGFSRLQSKTLGDNFRLCPTERFVAQPSAGLCSGFIATQNIGVTAGHCFDTVADPSEFAIVFDYNYDSAQRDASLIPNSSIYQSKRLLARKNDDHGLDFAIFELDRAVEDRIPISLTQTKTLAKNTPLTIVGYPLGLPMKIAGNGRLRSQDEHADLLVAEIDSLKGNSGSIVFDSISKDIAGILVRQDGQDFDLFYDEVAGCKRVNHCQDKLGCSGEILVSAAKISEYLPISKNIQHNETNIFSSLDENLTLPPLETTKIAISVIKKIQIGELNVALQMEHKMPSQVKLSLQSPDGRIANLERPEHWTDVHIHTVFGEQGSVSPELRIFQGTQGLGIWYLTVTNQSKSEAGILKKASLSVAIAKEN